MSVDSITSHNIDNAEFNVLLNINLSELIGLFRVSKGKVAKHA